MFDHQSPYPLSSENAFARGILLLDDCEGTFNYIKSGTGADYVADYNSAAAFVGTNGLRLQTRATDPAENDNVKIYKIVSWPESKKLCVRFRVGLPDVSLVQQVVFFPHIANGSAYYLPKLAWYPNTPGVWYTNAAGTTTEISGFDIAVNDNCWHTIEVVFDLHALTWLDVRFAGQKADLSSVALYNEGADSETEIWLNWQIMANGAAQATAYLDLLYAGELDNI